MSGIVGRLAVLGATASLGILATALPANASAGLFLASYSNITSGNLNVYVEYACDGGSNGTLTVVAAEGILTAGTASVSVPCDSNEDFITVHVSPTVGSWSAPGTATESAVLLNASGVQVAEVLPMNVSIIS